MSQPPKTLQSPPATTNFFSSGLRQKVDALMDILWSGGVNNPATSIEQISYLLFLKLLSERDEQKASIGGKKYPRIFSGKWSRFAWPNFVTLTGQELFTAVREAIENFHELPGLTDTGKLLFSRATLKIFDIPALKACITMIHGLDLTEHDGVDLKGDMYEYLLSRLAVSGTNGQFRTPRHIIDMIVSLVDPQPHHRICDPACGTGGFLIAAYNHILRQNTKPADLAKGRIDGSKLKPSQWSFLAEHAFSGYDNDSDMVKIAIMNLYLHRLEKVKVQHHNPLTSPLPGSGGTYPGKNYDIILANPPFAGSIQKESILADINLPTRDTELLFAKWFIDHLSPGGKAGVIVPTGVLFAVTKSAKAVRELLLTECNLQAVISLPNGIFRPYSPVGTAVLIFQKRPSKISIEQSDKAQFVWFYEVLSDGFGLDDKRNPIDSNNIPDLMDKWPHREEGPNCYRVPYSRLLESDLSLAAGRYRTLTTAATSHADPTAILSAIVDLEGEIVKRRECT